MRTQICKSQSFLKDKLNCSAKLSSSKSLKICKSSFKMGHEGMKYSLVTRELIADSVECIAKAHQFDALVMIPNCDKIVPGMLMAAARLDLPTE